MVKRIPLILLLVVQALGGGAITLAHARDAVAESAHIEASHDTQCAILHDEVRCALCHYAGARVITQQVLLSLEPSDIIRLSPQPLPISLANFTRLTAPARAPPALS